MKPTHLKFLISLLLVAPMLSGYAQQLPTAKPEDAGMSSERLKRFSEVFLRLCWCCE